MKQAQTPADEGLEIRAVQGDAVGLGPDCHRRDERIGLEPAFAAGGIEQLDRQLGGVLTDRQNTSFEECARQAGLVSASRPVGNSYQTGALTATAFPDSDVRQTPVAGPQGSGRRAPPMRAGACRCNRCRDHPRVAVDETHQFGVSGHRGWRQVAQQGEQGGPVVEVAAGRVPQHEGMHGS